MLELYSGRCKEKPPLSCLSEKNFSFASADTYKSVCVARTTDDLNEEKNLRRKLRTSTESFISFRGKAWLAGWRFQPSTVYDINSVTILKMTYNSNKDHSKWGVSMNPWAPHVCVGDVNRQSHSSNVVEALCASKIDNAGKSFTIMLGPMNIVMHNPK
ncbi:hypothetical protein RB195_002844 [Necator americanus]|uniref:Uncharacterized protein n=1 Tax=Necator americanus TaxID=51031 RepID=A0ABR1DLL5_NECAM